MIALISPAKSLDFDSPSPKKSFSHSLYLNDSQHIINTLKKFSPKKISSLMNISLELGHLNYNRFNQWKLPFDPENAKQAIFAFNGDLYQGLNANTLSAKHLEFAQTNLRILSGLYGILKPLDLIQPYRLEMATKLNIKNSNNLYHYWSEKITNGLNQDIKDTKSKYILNLASNEYFKSIDKKRINAEIITPVFKDLKNGNYKIISYFAKKARGLMARYFVENDITNPQQIKGFNRDRYLFNHEMSSQDLYVFTRD